MMILNLRNTISTTRNTFKTGSSRSNLTLSENNIDSKTPGLTTLSMHILVAAGRQSLITV